MAAAVHEHLSNNSTGDLSFNINMDFLGRENSPPKNLHESFDLKALATNIDFLNVTFMDLIAKNNELQNQVSKLAGQVYCLEKDLAHFQQYGRRENVEITGIPESVGHDKLLNYILLLFSKIGMCNLTRESFHGWHRLKKKNRNKPANVIVRFVNRQDAYDALERRKLLKGIPGHQNIYIIENLCPKYQDIFDKCNELKRDHCINRAWTYNGIVHYKTSIQRNSRGKKVFHMDELDAVFPPVFTAGFPPAPNPPTDGPHASLTVPPVVAQPPTSLFEGLMQAVVSSNDVSVSTLGASVVEVAEKHEPSVPFITENTDFRPHYVPEAVRHSSTLPPVDPETKSDDHSIQDETPIVPCTDENVVAGSIITVCHPISESAAVTSTLHPLAVTAVGSEFDDLCIDNNHLGNVSKPHASRESSIEEIVTKSSSNLEISASDDAAGDEINSQMIAETSSNPPPGVIISISNVASAAKGVSDTPDVVSAADIIDEIISDTIALTASSKNVSVVQRPTPPVPDIEKNEACTIIDGESDCDISVKLGMFVPAVYAKRAIEKTLVNKPSQEEFDGDFMHQDIHLDSSLALNSTLETMSATAAAASLMDSWTTVND